MKKLITLLGITICTYSIFAQSTSNLIVFSEDGYKFYLVLNGIKQNEVPQVNVKVVGLNQPYYSAKIIFEDKKQPILEKKYLSVSDEDTESAQEVTYKIKKNNKLVNVMRFYSAVPIAQAIPSSANIQEVHYHTEPLPEINNTEVIQQTSTTNSGNNGNVGINMNGLGVSVNINAPLFNDNTTITSTTTTTTSTRTTTSKSTINNTNNTNNNTINTNNTNTSTYVQQAPVTYGCDGSTPMTTSTFDSAKKTIGKQSFEETKLTTARQIIASNCLSTAQIKQIMALFSFEESKLTFAKEANKKCTDKNNYFMLNDAFSFESSVEELNNSIK